MATVRDAGHAVSARYVDADRASLSPSTLRAGKVARPEENRGESLRVMRAVYGALVSRRVALPASRPGPSKFSIVAVVS